MPPDISPESVEPTPLDASDTAPLAVAAPPAPVKAWYAMRRIQHGSQIFEPDGKPLPANFPADSLKRLILEKSIGEQPPGVTKVSYTPAKPA